MENVNEFSLDEIKNFAAKKYSTEFSLDDPKGFLTKIQSGDIPIGNLMVALKNNPEILSMSYKGLNFLHYLVLNNSYTYVKYVLGAALDAGLKELPLTGQVVSSTKFSPNQQFMEFLISQGCDESYLAVATILRSIQNDHVAKTLIDAAFKAEPKWIKFFKNIYGAEKVENCLHNKFFQEPYLVYEPMKKFKDFDKLKNNCGIDVFRETDGTNILAKLLENPKSFRTMLRNNMGTLEKTKKVAGYYIYEEYHEFLINLTTHPRLKTTTPIISDRIEQKYKTVGEALSQALEFDIPNHQEVISKFEKRIMEEESQLNNSNKKKPSQKLLKF